MTAKGVSKGGRSSRFWLANALLILAAAACGTAVPHAQVVEAARGDTNSPGSGQNVRGGIGASGESTTPGGPRSAGPDIAPGADRALQSPQAGGGPKGVGSGPTNSPSMPAGADTSPIIIASVGSYSGAPGAVEKASAVGVQVWAASVNAAGGVAGHPVKVLVGDDQSDPSRYRSLVQDFVENQHVIAFVGNEGQVQAGQQYLEQKRIPVIGSGDGTPTWHESFVHFSVAADADALPYGDLAEAKQEGKGKLAVLSCVESSACATWSSAAQRYAPKIGVALVYQAQISITQADFTSECLNARNDGAQAIAVVADTNTLYRVARSCGQQGYTPTYIVGTPSDSDIQKPDLRGGIAAMHTFPYFGVPGNPLSDEYLAAVQRYAPDTPRMEYLATGWASGKVFQRAVEAGIGSRRPTSAEVLDGLWSLKLGDTLGGLVAPLHYNKNAPNPQPFCYYMAIVGDGRYTAPKGMAATCPAP